MNGIHGWISFSGSETETLPSRFENIPPACKYQSKKKVKNIAIFLKDDDSDDEKMVGATPSRAPNNRNVRLFSTPQHNPNNPFNATPERTVPVAKPVHYK